jgi:guanine deaminase
MTAAHFYLRKAISLAVENVEAGAGGPFGALIVQVDQILASGTNRVTADHDPIAHAEIVAIRVACQELGKFALPDCEAVYQL